MINSLKLWRVRRLKYISLFKLILEGLNLSALFFTKKGALRKPSTRPLAITNKK